MKTFDPTKPVQTRDGRKARIVCVDKEGGQPIVALITNGEVELIEQFQFTGAWNYANERGASQNDLINIPEVKSSWGWLVCPFGGPFFTEMARAPEGAIRPEGALGLYRFDLSKSGELTMHKESLE